MAAIDCAMEENMPTCREYEVMGYPSLKFFTPNTPTGDMGVERHSREKTVPAIKRDMIQFITDLQIKKSEKAGRNWPSLVPARYCKLSKCPSVTSLSMLLKCRIPSS